MCCCVGDGGGGCVILNEMKDINRKYILRYAQNDRKRSEWRGGWGHPEPCLPAGRCNEGSRLLMIGLLSRHCGTGCSSQWQVVRRFRLQKLTPEWQWCWKWQRGCGHPEPCLPAGRCNEGSGLLTGKITFPPLRDGLFLAMTEESRKKSPQKFALNSTAKKVPFFLTKKKIWL